MPVGDHLESPIGYYQGYPVVEAIRYPEHQEWVLQVEFPSGSTQRVTLSEEVMVQALSAEFNQRNYQAPPRKPNDQGVIDYLATIAREAV